MKLQTSISPRLILLQQWLKTIRKPLEVAAIVAVLTILLTLLSFSLLNRFLDYLTTCTLYQFPNFLTFTHFQTPHTLL